MSATTIPKRSCILGYDWHSSGVTTTLCGALKEGLKGLETDLGLFVAGGKGKTSRRTPPEIEDWGNSVSLNPAPLVYASRMSAKVDSSAIQDGYQLYHHTFLFTNRSSWAVMQQGMKKRSAPILSSLKHNLPFIYPGMLYYVVVKFEVLNG